MINSPISRPILPTIEMVTESLPPNIGTGPAPVVPTWNLYLDGSNSATLSEPVQFSLDSDLKIVFSTTIVAGTQGALIGSTVEVTDSISFYAADRVRLIADGNAYDVLYVDMPNWNDGNEHTLRYHHASIGNLLTAYYDGTEVKSEYFYPGTPAVFDVIGIKGNGSDGFEGVIHIVDTVDEITPANNISWKLNSGPPDPAGTLPDGTVYEPSNEYGTQSDIMRPDEWVL